MHLVTKKRLKKLILAMKKDPLVCHLNECQECESFLCQFFKDSMNELEADYIQKIKSVYKQFGVDLDDKEEDIYTSFDGESITISSDSNDRGGGE